MGDVWGWQTLVAEAAETDNITALMSRALPQTEVVIMKLLFVVVQCYYFLSYDRSSHSQYDLRMDPHLTFTYVENLIQHLS